jgi:hypothetical protein
MHPEFRVQSSSHPLPIPPPFGERGPDAASRITMSAGRGRGFPSDPLSRLRGRLEAVPPREGAFYPLLKP